MTTFKEQLLKRKSEILMEKADIYETVFMVGQRIKVLDRRLNANSDLGVLVNGREELAAIRELLDAALVRMEELNEIQEDLDSVLDYL